MATIDYSAEGAAGGGRCLQRSRESGVHVLEAQRLELPLWYKLAHVGRLQASSVEAKSFGSAEPVSAYYGGALPADDATSKSHGSTTRTTKLSVCK